ncbi:globin-like protein [Microdochium trichocladiopsis]|uniref:nitric oxide dioxygenase n=1 Tax=Microdochium trichocladiopsis TaxID=1682393 RepID=A0A9P8Y9B3_9PEZI|nr:globin-like protein [Microdochium trichocladiopsis]KAH7031154.1 globin-like protein [Microdochium trichocladiopsis]
MALNHEQTRLIKATVPLIRQDGERIATLFYTNMIRDHPGMHAYFNPISMQRGHQPKAFTMMMLAFASSINDISGLVARMEKVAHKHASLAITPDLYDIVGDYLLRAFAEVLGPHCWTRAIREAWERAYSVMAGMLTRREALIYRDFGSWVGWRRFVVAQRWTELADGNDGEGDIVTIEVRPEDGKKLPPFQPGQYVSLRLSAVPGRDHPQLRQYYLCGDPASSSTYRFTVRRDASRETEHFRTESRHVPQSSVRPGVVSSMLIDQVMVGDVLELTHPAGEFSLEPASSENTGNAPIVLISAGTQPPPPPPPPPPDRPISWVHGSRHRPLYGNQVRDLAKRFPERLGTTFFKTRLADSDVLSYTVDFVTDLNVGRVRPVEDLYLRGGGGMSGQPAEYYVCGPHRFMIEVKKYLESNRVDPSRIKFGMLEIGSMDKKD